MNSNKHRDLEKLKELASLKSQVEEVGLQGKLSKQIFHQKFEKVVILGTETQKKYFLNFLKNFFGKFY